MALQVEWPHGALDTLDADAFYRQVVRTGIRYGPRFKMLLKKSTDGSAAVLRHARRRPCSAACAQCACTSMHVWHSCPHALLRCRCQTSVLLRLALPSAALCCLFPCKPHTGILDGVPPS